MSHRRPKVLLFLQCQGRGPHFESRTDSLELGKLLALGKDPLSDAAQDRGAMKPRHEHKDWPEKHANQNNVKAHALQQYEADSIRCSNSLRVNTDKQ